MQDALAVAGNVPAENSSDEFRAILHCAQTRSRSVEVVHMIFFTTASIIIHTLHSEAFDMKSGF